jgi:hypothetical protein
VQAKSIQIKGSMCSWSRLFAIPAETVAKNPAVDGTMLDWVGYRPHPIGIKSAFDGTEQIF